jgi:hypothetical protein
MSRLSNAVVSVLAALAAGALLFVTFWMNDFGPAFLADGWFADTLQIYCWLLAASVILFGSARHFGHWVELAGSFAALGVALFAIQYAVDDAALAHRGHTTRCVIVRVTEREQTSTDANGDSQTTTYYDNTVRCAARQVRSVVTSRPAGKPRQRIDVVYDPIGRLAPVPANKVGGSGTALWVSIVALALGALLRGVSELRGRREAPWFFGIDGVRRIWLGVVAAVVGLVWLLLFFGSVRALWRLVGLVLGLLGTDRAGLGALHWLVDIPAWAASAAVVGRVIGWSRRLFVRVLGAHRWFDPDGQLRDFLAGLDVSTSFGFGLGGWSASLDSGFLAFLPAPVKRLIGRLLRSRRGAATGPD